MIVELINTCNLKCTYCFEKCQDERIAKIMPVEVLEKAIDFLVSKRENCHLTFFGGEPTLCRELIAKGIEYGNKLAREKKSYIAYSIVTNGTILDEEFLHLLNVNNVNIVFSFDGNEYYQNKYRPYLDGRNTYSDVLGNLKKLVKTREDERYGHLVVRPTITAEMIDYINEIYADLRLIGCKEISFSLVSASEEAEYAIKKDDIPKLKEEYLKMIDNYYEELKRGVSYNKFFEGLLARIEEENSSTEFCDCGKRYIAISVEGNIFPCEGFLGIDAFQMGSILDGKILTEWKRPENVCENKKCCNCWAKYLCGGSCYHEAWMRTGSINERDELICETYKIAIECALRLYVKLKEADIDVAHILKASKLPERSKPKINNAEIRMIEDDFIYVGDGINHRVIKINETAKKICSLCTGENTISDISFSLMEEYGQEIFSDVNDFVKDLLENGIIKLLI